MFYLVMTKYFQLCTTLIAVLHGPGCQLKYKVAKSTRWTLYVFPLSGSKVAVRGQLIG